MLACVDVDYRGERGPAVACCIVFESWESAVSHQERIAVIPEVAPYVPGQFYRRELPCILEVLRRCPTRLDAIIIDGHVWLDDQETPGLGAHLHRALDEKTPVVGVAKNPYRNARVGRHVLRGTSRKPLFVTAIGIDVDVAAEKVRKMHGTHRRPTLLMRADRVCRKCHATTG